MPDRMNGVSYQPEGMYQFWNTHNGDAQLRIDFIPRHSCPKAYTVHQQDLTTEFVKSVVDASEHNPKDHTIKIKGITYSTRGYAKLEHGTVFFLHREGHQWPSMYNLDIGRKGGNFLDNKDN
jgi:2-polyprenyl-6-methoxyphenol hydroxylase-like FAD-dependent oxidoreductase